PERAPPMISRRNTARSPDSMFRTMPAPTVTDGPMITNADLQRRLDTRTKPQGSLGALETLAIRIGLALDTDTPKFQPPQMFVFAADHGIATDGVSAFPQSVTAQMLLNYLSSGAAINVLARQHGIMLRVVDAGVASDIGEHPSLVARAVARSTRNFRIE